MEKDPLMKIFVTSPNEVEGYGLLKKITSPLLGDFFPERSDLYDEVLTNSISADEVLASINNNKNPKY